MNAIEIQVADEHDDSRVVDSLFASLSLAAEPMGSPAGVHFRQRVVDCREHIAKRLSRRAAGGR